MRRYNIINNTLGWLAFFVAALTYLLTIEPTASFWDCPEFITQGFKLEVGHPPGNPIFMLTARFFVTVFGGGAQTAAIAVNSMSALLSAGTILLLFWTITHLVRRLIVRDRSAEVSTLQTILIMAAGMCGALAYTWSDTFWFSAVEGEVYAFSSFCTALVFWLILKWENRADNPGSDRYLILIAYVIGISIAVHLLNLLAIPAIVLVVYYRKFKNTNLVGSLIALAVSFAIVALILYGLVPGFMDVAQSFELVCVNTLGMGYNMGVLVYAIITTAVFLWTIYELRRQDSAWRIRLGVTLSIILSGMPFIGHGLVIPTLLIIALVTYLWGFCHRIPVRIFNIVIWSIFVIFIGYSSYALLLIRSTAYTPMNQNEPDNPFSLASYLNREQYGQTPLLYGPKISETIPYLQAQDYDGTMVEYLNVDEYGNPVFDNLTTVPPVEYDNDGTAINLNDKGEYAKIVKTDDSQPDKYIRAVNKPEYKVPEGMGTIFPRMYSDRPEHVRGYKSWSMYESPQLELRIPDEYRQRWAQNAFVERQEFERSIATEPSAQIKGTVNVNGHLSRNPIVWQNSFSDNLRYFVNYQLNHMYWRYFMWNFAGRQNDLQGNGEPHRGNWISGIPFIDNARLGDQSLLPEEYGEGNKGHNVFYMLPLLLGLLGIIWQALMHHPGAEKRGIEQFWIVFFLFFMTGIAIVLYLNQPPGQPRERDYAFAGSFYAFAIWIGLGIPALFHMLRNLVRFCKTFTEKPAKTKTAETTTQASDEKTDLVLACIASVVAIAIPIQMVSQTWDDHDRSGRYAARDFGFNYLNSLDENAVIFVNGDNDTFPLWYAQETEGVRTDVKVVNLSYLTTDWYARQIGSNTYDAKGAPFYMTNDAMEYGNFRAYNFVTPSYDGRDITAKELLQTAYRRGSIDDEGTYIIGGQKIADRLVADAIKSVYVPIDSTTLIKRFGTIPYGLSKDEKGLYHWNLDPGTYLGSQAGLSPMLTYDIIARAATEGFNRPVYFASTVGNSYYLGFSPNMYISGMAFQVTPFNKQYDASPIAAKAYCNIVGKFVWGGLDSGKDLYLDETIRRMVSSIRISILTVVEDLLETPDAKATAEAIKVSKERNLPAPKTYADMAHNLLTYMTEKMPPSVAPYDEGIDTDIAQSYARLATITRNTKDLDIAAQLVKGFLDRSAKLIVYANSLDDYSFASLADNEQRIFMLTINAVSILDYTEIARKIFNKIDDENFTDTDLVNLCELMIDPAFINTGMLVLVERPKLENLYAAIDEEGDESAVYAAHIYAGYEMSGVSPTKNADAFLKKAGISTRQWYNLITKQ